jgi:hypothetical protein
MEYTQKEYCDMLLAIGTCNSQGRAAAREYAPLFWGVIQTLMCFDDQSSIPWERVRKKRDTYGTRECRSPTGYTYTSQCTRYNNKVRELANVCFPWQQWTEASVWFDDVGISAFYSCVVVIVDLHEKVRRKRPERFANNSWVLRHGNAPAYTALYVREF